jgi:hypothetical protein
MNARVYEFFKIPIVGTLFAFITQLIIALYYRPFFELILDYLIFLKKIFDLFFDESVLDHIK